MIRGFGALCTLVMLLRKAYHLVSLGSKLCSVVLKLSRQLGTLVNLAWAICRKLHRLFFILVEMLWTLLIILKKLS